MQIVIVEDEKLAARRLERMLRKEGLGQITSLHSLQTAIDWFKNNTHPDLIFLDIQLSDGISFEIFDHVKIDSSIIFTTAFDEYALRAFKHNSIDYLLKPIDEKELHDSIKKFHHFNPSANTGIKPEQLQQIKQLLTSPSVEYKERLTAKVGTHLRTIPCNDIECFYSEQKASFIHTLRGSNYSIDYSLEQLEELMDPNLFFRVSRKFIIHINAIKDIIAYSNSRLKIKLHDFDLHEIIVSRDKVKLFKQWLG